jgi:hypothetical protein
LSTNDHDWRGNVMSFWNSKTSYLFVMHVCFSVEYCQKHLLFDPVCNRYFEFNGDLIHSELCSCHRCTITYGIYYWEDTTVGHLYMCVSVTIQNIDIFAQLECMASVLSTHCPPIDGSSIDRTHQSRFHLMTREEWSLTYAIIFLRIFSPVHSSTFLYSATRNSGTLIWPQKSDLLRSNGLNRWHSGHLVVQCVTWEDNINMDLEEKFLRV